jgi:hypothetical protein
MYGLSLQYLGDGLLNGLLPQSRSGSLSGQFRARLDYMFRPDVTDSDTTAKYEHTGPNDFDLALAAGLEVKLGERFSAAPYLGLGYFRDTKTHTWRLLPDDPGWIVFDVGGKSKIATDIYYLPIGADWKMSLPRGWKLALNTQLDIFLYQKSKASTSWNTKLRRTGTEYTDDGKETETYTDSLHGTRFNLALKAEKNFGKVGIFVEPFYRVWNGDNDGNTGESFSEREYGLRAGVTF